MARSASTCGKSLLGKRTMFALPASSENTQVKAKFTGMFAGCESLAELDLKSFRTADVNNFSYMFENCRNLERLVIAKGGFIIQKDAVTDKMFAGCDKLGVEKSNLMKGRPRESYM